jgi:CRISPR-associated exonuclease Cas4
VILPAIIVLCLLLALVLFWLAERQLKSAGVPGGRIISSDTTQWQPVAKPLYAPSMGLTGRPDYLIEGRDTLIPVEVKSTRKPLRSPYDSHILQLGAYCLLVEAEYGIRPTHGVLHYTRSGGEPQTFSIPFSAELETETRAVIDEIQTQSLRGGVDRSHESPARCAGCGYLSRCDQAL